MGQVVVMILSVAGLAYLGVGLVVMFRLLRRRRLSSSDLPPGGPGDGLAFLVVAALWPLYIRR
jgi:hypothetical protein